MKVETPFKGQVVIANDTPTITMLVEALKDQMAILICEDLKQAQLLNNLREDLQVILI